MILAIVLFPNLVTNTCVCFNREVRKHFCDFFTPGQIVPVFLSNAWSIRIYVYRQK